MKSRLAEIRRNSMKFEKFDVMESSGGRISIVEFHPHNSDREWSFIRITVIGNEGSSA